MAATTTSTEIPRRWCLCGESLPKRTRGFPAERGVPDSEALTLGWRNGRSPRVGVPMVLWWSSTGPLICPRANESPLGGASVDMWWCPQCVVEAGRVPRVGSCGFGGLVVWLGYGAMMDAVTATPLRGADEPSLRQQVLLYPQTRDRRPAVRAMLPGRWVVGCRMPAVGEVTAHQLTRTVMVRAGEYSHVSFEQGVPR